MHIDVIYESLYGNTEAIAKAIAEGIHEAAPNATVEVHEASEPPHVAANPDDLVILGGPTHAWRMSTAATRRNAPKRPGDVDATMRRAGVREVITELTRSSRPCRAATFDTRLGVRWSGGASRQIARHLRRAGYEIVARPEGFVVTSTVGPIAPGELDRASQWGYQLARELVVSGNGAS